MTQPTLLLGIAVLTFSPALPGQALDNAEVRLPYAELKQLLARAESPAKPPAPRPALLSARFRLLIENDRPVLDATFRAASFAGEVALIPLLAGDVSLEQQDPKDAVLVAEGKSLCLAVTRAGSHTLRLRLLPIVSNNRISLSLPACPSVILETGELPADQAVVLGTGASEETLGAGQVRPLSHAGQELTIRLLDRRETREALRPPEPSTWTWQNQALVRPADDGLVYQISARASAPDGSGVAAILPMPPGAQDVMAVGEDLASQAKIPGENRAPGLKLEWKTRGILDRQVMVSYRLPLRPLDRTWRLQAPGGEGTRTRFMIATTPLLAYAAEGLSGPLAAQGLPAALAEALQGVTFQQLEAATTADLTVTPVPVAATAEGVVTSAEWSLKIEPDGAMLATGVLTIGHKSSLGFVFDTPEGMKLLSCEAGGNPVSPVDLGAGGLKVVLSPQNGKSVVSCAFTGRATALDPVEGTVGLALPKVPLFIDSLVWHLDLPAGYQAETHGNLTRQQVAAGAPPSRITLKKNLCRDERPEIQVFYQRSDLNR